MQSIVRLILFVPAASFCKTASLQSSSTSHARTQREASPSAQLRSMSLTEFGWFVFSTVTTALVLPGTSIPFAVSSKNFWQPSAVKNRMCAVSCSELGGVMDSSLPPHTSACSWWMLVIPLTPLRMQVWHSGTGFISYKAGISKGGEITYCSRAVPGSAMLSHYPSGPLRRASQDQ